MARIKSSDTSPEIRLRRALWARGLRYHLQHKIEKIQPDLVFERQKMAVFVDGCQWHGCPEHYVRPRSKEEFWRKKLRDCVERDVAQTALLRSRGWLVYRVWEHEIWESLYQVVTNIIKAQQESMMDIENEWRVFQVDIVDLANDIEKRYLLDLNSPSLIQTSVRKRSTRKWRRP